MFYDDTTTLLFLKALHSLMRQNARLTAFVAAERRIVFSAHALKIVSLGYDTFQAHVCVHDPETAARPSELTTNRVVCRACRRSQAQGEEKGGEDETNIMRFRAEAIELEHIPHVLSYERPSTMYLWHIYAIVEP